MRARRLWLPCLLSACFLFTVSSHAQNAPKPRKRVIIAITGMDYSPSIVTVNMGDEVVWVNKDVVPHTVTDAKGSWNLGDLQPKQFQGYFLTLQVPTNTSVSIIQV